MAFPTNPIYKLLKNPLGVVDSVMTKTGDSEPYKITIIPFVNDNTQYQKYLEWAKTNTAEEAD
tara:strand:- start:359 stop:547 length:189 start_codon:yes stop_codon:yes gene_type:complete